MNNPYIKDAVLLGNTTFKVTFSQKMSEDNLLKAKNYKIVGSTQKGSNSYVKRDIGISSIQNVSGNNDSTILLIKFTQEVEYFESITLTVNRVKSISNDTIDMNRNSFSNSLMPPLNI